MQKLSHFGASKPIIFCDFDGTVTETDNIIALMKEFAPPEWEGVKDKILGQEISVREGVGQLFSMIPSTKKGHIVDFLLTNARIRDGFKEFVDYTKTNGYELYIVSGGIDFFVEPMLKNYELEIYCNRAHFDKEMIRIEWPYSCDDQCQNDCGCCKPSLLRKLGKGRSAIVIGDSITDLQAAKQADFVIARDFLLEKCEDLQLEHAPFTTFFDVMDIMEKKVIEYE